MGFGAILGGSLELETCVDVCRGGGTLFGDSRGIHEPDWSVSLVEVFAGDSSLVNVPWRTRVGLPVGGVRT